MATNAEDIVAPTELPQNLTVEQRIEFGDGVVDTSAPVHGVDSLEHLVRFAPELGGS